jgi:RNA polymerase sigma factor (sigma-70 family)
LWQGIRDGDERALEILYSRHYQVLFRYAYKLTREKQLALDSVQELFFQLWTRREKLGSVQSVRFYLMKWLKREVIRLLNNKHHGSQVVGLESDQEYPDLVVEDLLDRKETLSHNAVQVRKALEQLSKREREVIYMRFFLELTYEEICEAMNLSYQVVMNYMHRALKALRSSNLVNNLFRMVLVFLSGLPFLDGTLVS